MQTQAIITGPLHAHGARSREEYLDKQRMHLTALERAYPHHGARPVWHVVGQVNARISGGRWIVDCPCANCPSASPEWNLAACFECGAVYEDVVFPADRERVEAMLVARPQPQNRHWFPHETLDDLARENVAHGHEVPA